MPAGTQICWLAPQTFRFLEDNLLPGDGFTRPGGAAGGRNLSKSAGTQYLGRGMLPAELGAFP